MLGDRNPSRFVTALDGTERLIGAPLENYANNSSPSPRNRRYTLRSSLWALSSLQRLKSCGRHVRTGSGKVGVRMSPGLGAGFSGLVSCGSVWCCPVCSSKVSARRCVEIGCVVAQALAEGLSVVMLTVTLRHDRGQKLAPLWDALATCWKRATGGKSWTLAVDRFGVVGYVKAVEVTHGGNGWHPHVHAVLICRAGLTDREIEELCSGLWQRWASAARSQGLASPLMHASEWHRVSADGSAGTSIGDYLAKGVMAAGSIGMELTQTQSKIARSVHSTRSLWDVCTAAVTNGEAADVRTWMEWERASKGRRQIAWTKGLRERFALAPEVDDETIAAEEVGTEGDTVCWITRAGWSSMVRRPELIPVVLDVLEAGGWPALESLLTENGIGYERINA